MASDSSTIFFDTSSKSVRNSARKPCFGAAAGALTAAKTGAHSRNRATANRIFIATKLLLSDVRQQRVIGAEDHVFRLFAELSLHRHRLVRLHRYQDRGRLVSFEVHAHRRDEQKVGRDV